MVKRTSPPTPPHKGGGRIGGKAVEPKNGIKVIMIDNKKNEFAII
jgi:hypothetical protein